MHRDVIGLAALDLILRLILARVMSVSLVISVLCMNFDNGATDVAGFRMPGHVIADLESFGHHEPPITL
jgi:hypothetical protein